MFVRDDSAADSDTQVNVDLFASSEVPHGALALKILDVGPWNWRPM